MCFELRVLEPARDPDAGRVDEHVEAALAGDVLLDDARAVLRLRDVRRDRVGAELGRRRLDLLGRARGEREREALLAKHPPDREPDARGAAGDERRCHASRLSQTWRGGDRTANPGADPRLLLSPATAAPRPPLRRPWPLSPPGRRAGDAPASFSDAPGKTRSVCCRHVGEPHSARAERRLRGEVLGRAGSRSSCAGFVPAEAENLLVGLARPTTPPSTGSTTSARSSSRSTSSRRSSTTRRSSAGSPRRTRSTTSSRWAGSPLLALSIAAFPESLPNETLAAVFGAADEQVRAAGAILAGGHTLRDEEPKYGLAVVGTVHPDGFWSKSGARSGDAIFLTKPLGTGMLLHAAREGRRHEEGLAPATHSMTTLSREAADVLRPFAPHCRHRRDRLRAARPRARDGRAERRPDRARRVAALPLFPGALEARRGGGAHRRRPPEPRLRGRARGGGRRRRGAASRSPTTRRPPAGCSSRCRGQGRRARGDVRGAAGSSSPGSAGWSRARASGLRRSAR